MFLSRVVGWFVGWSCAAEYLWVFWENNISKGVSVSIQIRSSQLRPKTKQFVCFSLKAKAGGLSLASLTVIVRGRINGFWWIEQIDPAGKVSYNPTKDWFSLVFSGPTAAQQSLAGMEYCLFRNPATRITSTETENVVWQKQNKIATGMTWHERIHAMLLAAALKTWSVLYVYSQWQRIERGNGSLFDSSHPTWTFWSMNDVDCTIVLMGSSMKRHVR